MTTWLQHVKKVHASGNTSFKDSLKRASASWKKTKGASTKTAKPKRKRGKKAKAEEKTSTEEQEAPVKKKRRRKAKRSTPKIPAGAFKSVDSRNL